MTTAGRARMLDRRGPGEHRPARPTRVILAGGVHAFIDRAPSAIRADLDHAERDGAPIHVHGRRLPAADVVRIVPPRPPAPPPPKPPAPSRGRPPRSVFRPTRAGARAWLDHAGRVLAADLARHDIDPETLR